MSLSPFGRRGGFCDAHSEVNPVRTPRTGFGYLMEE
jgi:hypothetical protein